tara:strand:- start:1558 stop:1857 length:300 start_codon:yes stop_codon:yes gene_type:complete
MYEKFIDAVQYKYKSCLASLEANYTGFFFYPFDVKDDSIDVMHEYTSVTLTFIDMEPVVQIIVTNHEKTVKIHNHQCHFDGTIDKLRKALELVLTLYHK